jgi:hypothetical protein
MSQIFLVRSYPHKRKRRARRVPAEKTSKLRLNATKKQVQVELALS